MIGESSYDWNRYRFRLVEVRHGCFQNRSKRTRCAVDGRKLSAGNEPESTVRADAGRTSLVFRGMSGVRQSDPDLQPVQRTEGSRSANPYGRHYSASVPGVADYDETAYMFCPLSRNHSDPGNMRRTPTDKAGRELYALMRDQFDRYVYIWEKTTGLHVGRGYARELLSMWRADEGWRY